MNKLKNIEWELQGQIGILKINNSTGNSLVEPEFIDFEELNKLVNNNTLKGLIIINRKHASTQANIDNIHKLENLNIPTIAVIKGDCSGTALEIAMACHIKICSKNSSSEKALEMKIVDYVVPANQVFDFSINLMKKMTDDRQVRVIHSVVKAINNAKNMNIEEAMEQETKMFCKLAVDAANTLDI